MKEILLYTKCFVFSLFKQEKMEQFRKIALSCGSRGCNMTGKGFTVRLMFALVLAAVVLLVMTTGSENVQGEDERTVGGSFLHAHFTDEGGTGA